MIQAEHESLKVEYEQHKQKVKYFQMYLLLAGVKVYTWVMHCEFEIWCLENVVYSNGLFCFQWHFLKSNHNGLDEDFATKKILWFLVLTDDFWICWEK